MRPEATRGSQHWMPQRLTRCITNMWCSPSSPWITLPPHVQFWASRSPASGSIGARSKVEQRGPVHGERQWQRPPAMQVPANAQSASPLHGGGGAALVDEVVAACASTSRAFVDQSTSSFMCALRTCSARRRCQYAAAVRGS
eukprot:SAG31_NODE_39_length_31377_cov_5.971482_10_plen_142_part_00